MVCPIIFLVISDSNDSVMVYPLYMVCSQYIYNGQDDQRKHNSPYILGMK